MLVGMRLWIGFVRANYLTVAAIGSLPALLWGLQFLVSLFQRPQFVLGTPLIEIAVTLGGMCLLLIPAIRAIRRRIVSGTVIPAELARERPIVTCVVTLAGVVGHFCTAIVVSVVVDIAQAPEKGEDVGGPIVFVFSLAMLSYLIALLCGELALVGDGESDSARRASRGASPFASK
jgi:hypothetical protein